MNKKAELTTQQLVTLIILIVSFVVILFLLFRLNLGKETESELCHNSVIMRGSAVVLEDAVPLDCSRKYICITKDGSCKSMTKPEIKKVKTDSDVYKVLADEMANCWWMFGEGKIDYVGKTLFRNNYCSICSQISFDDNLTKIPAFSLGQLNQNLFYNYLVNENYTEGETYSEYLFGTKDLNEFKKQLKLNQSQEINFGTIDFSKQYFVVMGIVNEPQEVWKWGSGSVGATIGLKGLAVGLIKLGVLSSNPIGWIAGAVIVGGTTAVGVFSQLSYPEILAINVEGDGINNQFMAPTIIEAESDKFEALNCQEIITTA